MSVVSLDEQIIQPAGDKDGEYISTLKRLTVGSGDKTMRTDENGMFLGADNFSDAPYSVDYDGNILVKKASGEGVKISGEDNNIIVNDGTNDRVLIGYLAGKF